MHSDEFGDNVVVTVEGILRNQSRRDFAWYHYRFDIIRFESLSHVIVPYQGELERGKTYLARVRPSRDMGLAFIVPLRMPMHYAVRVEWMNLAEFPKLKPSNTSSVEQSIVFSVISDKTRHMTANRWNRTIECKLIRIEQ